MVSQQLPSAKTQTKHRLLVVCFQVKDTLLYIKLGPSVSTNAEYLFVFQSFSNCTFMHITDMPCDGVEYEKRLVFTNNSTGDE